MTDEKPVPPVDDPRDEPNTKLSLSNARTPAPLRTLEDHERWNRLLFGMALSACSVFLIVVLAVVQTFVSNTNPLAEAIEVLKLIAMTSLGFVFGRIPSSERNRKSSD